MCRRDRRGGVARVVAGCLDPNPEAAGGLERLRAGRRRRRAATIAFEARRQNEAWRTWKALGRPFVTYKAAVTLDGRVTVPGTRWVTGEASRRLVHELRAASDAVAVGMGTVRADAPRLDARDVPVLRQPRRLAFGRGPLPAGSELELRSGGLGEELAALAAEGVQSLLLEGGPTLATAFLEAGLVDRLLLFVAPTLSGDGPRFLGDLSAPRSLLHVSSAADRGRRARRGLPARAVARSRCPACSPGSFARSGRSSPSPAARRAFGSSSRRPATAALVDVGDSVAINGVCLTAETVEGERLTFHAVPETLSRSTLGELVRGSVVNLEPALRAGDPLGGHIVQGHVDGIGRVQSVEAEGEGLRVIVEASADTLRYCVEKGSITVDGVSLTVAELHDDAFGLALIPHTLAETTLVAARARAAASTSRSTCSRSTSSACSSRTGDRPRARRQGTMPR